MTEEKGKPKDNRTEEEINAANRLTTPPTFQDQVQYISELKLTSPGHVEGMQTLEPDYVHLQEMANKLSTIKAQRDADILFGESKFPFTLEEWDKLAEIINQKIEGMNITPEQLTQGEEHKGESFMKQSIGKEDLGSTLRKIKQTMDKIRATFEQKP